MNKRKFLVVIIALCSMLCISFSLTACGHKHNLTRHEPINPTCTTDGIIEHWECTDCGKYFSDRKGKTEITKTDTVIAAKGHSYGEDGVCAVCSTKKPSEGLNYSVLYDSYSVSGIGTCTDTDIVIPEEYNGMPVTSIGERAFFACRRVTSITIPAGVTSIGEYAFLNCSSLTNIEIPDSVTSIGNYAFQSCHSLASIEIPAGVTNIGNYIFFDCSSLASINVAAENTEYKSIDGNLYNKDCTTLLQYAMGKTNQNFTIPAGVTNIGDRAFYDCNSLTSIEIPASVTSISKYAFYNCSSLTSIEIPAGVTNIGDSAFYDCRSLTSITIPAGVTNIGYAAFRYCSGLTSITFAEGSQLTSISNDAFYKCYRLTSIEIPASVTSIGSLAFQGCSKLESIEISAGVTSIGEMAFFYCNGLTTVTFAEDSQLTSIGVSAFSSCHRLTSIEIPASVTNIGKRAFDSCIKLTKVYYKGTAEQWSKINIDSNNNYLINATRYYYSEIKPTTEGNYWHYVDGKIVEW